MNDENPDLTFTLDGWHDAIQDDADIQRFVACLHEARIEEKDAVRFRGLPLFGRERGCFCTIRVQLAGKHVHYFIYHGEGALRCEYRHPRWPEWIVLYNEIANPDWDDLFKEMARVDRP